MKFCLINLLLLPVLCLAFRQDTVPVALNNSDCFSCPITDSTSFTPDSFRGWGLYGAYVALHQDSVLFEVVLYQQKPHNINWNETFRIGRLDSAYTPDYPVTMDYREPTRKWQLSFYPTGGCFMRFVSGQAPSGNPVIVPLQVKFKKSGSVSN